MVQHIYYGDNLRLRRKIFLVLLRHKRPQLVYVDGRVPLRIARQVEVAHTNFTEVTRMVFIKVGSE